MVVFAQVFFCALECSSESSWFLFLAMLVEKCKELLDKVVKLCANLNSSQAHQIICAHLHAGKLSSLKLPQLREMYKALQLQTASSYSRKWTYTEPLNAYAKSCSVRK